MTLRRPGGRWRLLVHEYDPDNAPGGCTYTISHHVEPEGARNAPDDGWSRTHVLPGTCEFDELVVGRWLHVEQMTDTLWWMNVGGVTVHVVADRDGRPRRVSVAGPGDWNDPVEGCEYECTWTHDEQAQP